MKNRLNGFFVALACVAVLLVSLPLAAQEVTRSDVTIRHAPHVVSTVSSKTEKGRATCMYCSSTMWYDRKFKWDVYSHEWVETTKSSSIPQVCRACRQKEKDQERLDKEELELDRKIDYYETKSRISKKRSRLRQLRKETR